MIPRASLRADDVAWLDHRAAVARSHRERRRAAGVCICGPAPGSRRASRVRHEGPLDGSGRCPRCAAVKRGGAP